MICEHNCETEEFDPVCGVNSYNELRMFANLCHLETTICEDSMDIRPVEITCCFRSNFPSADCLY
uniref:Kazal-like domain-containing protein n=1 Tax=Megaselia scalaris TaxID=36166 RepID=T1GVN1_MEGSC